MEKKNIKILLVLASICIFIFACVTSVITIGYYNRRMQCLYNGAMYSNGDKFLSSDNCNMCACNNGLVACTLKACLNQPVADLPMKGIEVYCYSNNDSLVYSIFTGTNRMKTYDEVTSELKIASSPMASYTNKTKEEAKLILKTQYSYSETDANDALKNCTSAEILK